eukprot:TRINITY_DN12777_c0_g1_i1.p1 TRINITY_DN12777_c0_g1~~TRINITY_DN12777_c0_g1_i1.p1  ORF type:complete len:707 (-),score=81.89 TRINITY_DN12777_c0_g1_i1:765-2885(-)
MGIRPLWSCLLVCCLTHTDAGEMVKYVDCGYQDGRMKNKLEPPEFALEDTHPPSMDAVLQLRCTSWGYCHAPEIAVAKVCVKYALDPVEKAWNRHVGFEPAHPSIVAWFGVQSWDAPFPFGLMDCPEHSEPLGGPVVVFNLFYVIILLGVAMAVMSLFVCCCFAKEIAGQLKLLCRRQPSGASWFAEIWNDFPSLIEALPPDLWELARARLAENRLARFRACLVMCAVGLPLIVSSGLIEYLLPRHVGKSCSQYIPNSPMYVQLDHLQWQREVCMQQIVALLLGFVSLYSLLRPAFVTEVSMKVVTIAAHMGMMWHLLEVRRVTEYQDFFQLNYGMTRLFLGIAAGGVRLPLMLNCCLAVLELVKCSTEFSDFQAEFSRFILSSTVGIMTVIAFTYHQSVRDITANLRAQHATVEARRSQAILDTMCDAVAVLKDLVLTEACPKLESFLLHVPTAEGLLGRPFLGLVAEDDQARICSRIEEGTRAGEVAFVLHTKLQCAGQNHVGVQLCFSSDLDMYGHECHIVGIREEDIPDSGRLDSLPSQVPLPSTSCEMPACTATLACADGAAMSGLGSASSYGEVSQAEDIFDIITESPGDALPGTAAVWLHCDEAGRHDIIKVCRTFSQHLGPWLGVSDFKELLIDEKEEAKFTKWMVSAPADQRMSCHLRLRHWHQGQDLSRSRSSGSTFPRISLFDPFAWRYLDFNFV